VIVNGKQFLSKQPPVSKLKMMDRNRQKQTETDTQTIFSYLTSFRR